MKRDKYEDWGEWVDKSHMLKHHPLKDKYPDLNFVAAYNNKVISVQVSWESNNGYVYRHLWIRRHDGQPITWQEAQRAKNELISEDITFVEMYPAKEDTVDQAPMYHLFEVPDQINLPFELNR